MMIKKFTDDELIALLDDIENDRSERKESFNKNDAKKVLQAICAFANNLANHQEPSVLFIGAKDNGEPSHIDITDQLLQNIGHIHSNGKILPPPVINVEKRHLKGADMAVITVIASDAPPVRYDGRTWIRVGPRREIASIQEENILSERRRYKLQPFDLHPVAHANIDDINRDYFEQEYLPNAFARDVLQANGRSYIEKLATTRMITSIDPPTPTVMGCLTLTDRPRDFIPSSYIQFLRIDGIELSDPIIDQTEIDGRLFDILKKVDDKLQSHIRTALNIDTATDIKTPDYPIVAIQQLVRNAIMHRTYEHTTSPTRVTWFNDRIEIHSPGGPYGQVTVNNFGQPGVTDYRNPSIAEAMKILGYVQRFGIGISTARNLLKQNNNPDLKLEVNDSFVVAILYSS